MFPLIPQGCLAVCFGNGLIPVVFTCIYRLGMSIVGQIEWEDEYACIWNTDDLLLYKKTPQCSSTGACTTILIASLKDAACAYKYSGDII